MQHRFPVLLLLYLAAAVFCPDLSGFAESPPVQSPGDGRVTLEADLSASGSTLLSIPLDLGEMDVGAWLVAAGVSSKGIHGWDARQQKYVQLKTVRPGQGFLLARGPGKLPVSGERVSADAVEFSLVKGWNLIGVPYESSLPLATLQISLDGNTVNYSAATESKWVGGINALVDGRMTPLAVTTASLAPWRGYWLYAYQPCQLIFPSPQQATKAQAGKGKRPKKR